MRFPWTNPGKWTAMYLTPSGGAWLAGEPAEELVVTGGGSVCYEGPGFPPSPQDSELGAWLRQAGRRWNLVISLVARTTMVQLPLLADHELPGAVRWQAEKLFRLGQPTQIDFELLPGHGGSRSALLLAVENRLLDPWLEFIRRLPHLPLRMETLVTAVQRGLTWIARASGFSDRNVAFIYGDGEGGVIAIHGRGTPILVRNITAPADQGPWCTGERGIQIVRETLLAAEDRYPELELDGLVGLGCLASDWLDEASRLCHLPVLPPPLPPAGVPDELRREQRWLVAFGALLAGAASPAEDGEPASDPRLAPTRSGKGRGD